MLLKKNAISFVAFSSESEPCTAFSPKLEAYNFLIVPGSASSGLVAPIVLRHSKTASSFFNVSKRKMFF